MTRTFRDLIADNKRKSDVLVAGFFLFTAAVGFFLAMAVLACTEGDAHLHWPEAFVAGVVGTLIAFTISFFSYFMGDQMILGVSGARPLEKHDDPQLFNVVEEMAIAAGVPMPQVYLIDDPAPNAFATGRDPEHAAVAITTGLRSKLNREELQGVLAHEMSHIRNYDIRLMLLLAVLIGTIVMLTDVFWQFLRVSSSSSSSSDSKDSGKGGGLLVVMLLLVGIVLALIAPLLAQIIQLAVSREREYLADASAVELTRNPEGLAHALRKIEDDPAELRSANRGTAHLFIANPIKKFADRANTLLASHPPIQDRIARLEALLGHTALR